MSETIDQEKCFSESPRDVQTKCFSMAWEDEASELLSYVPEPVVAAVIKNTEFYAAKKGQNKVCRTTMSDLRKEMGMDLESMLTSCPYAVGKQKAS